MGKDNKNNKIFSEEEVLLSSLYSSDSSAMKEIESEIWKMQDLPYFIDGKGVGGNTIYDFFSDEKIIEAYNLLASTEGVLAEPASCAPIAGLIKLKDTIKPKSKIVCILTGNGLKDPDCAIKYAKSPVEKTTSEIKDIVKLMGL